MKLEDVDTPALLVNLDAMEFNLRSMADFFRDKPAKLRPHFKNHKSPALARRQLQAGAIGMTCATLREAEILVHHGIDHILVANEMAGDAKASQVADLSRRTSITVAIDSRSAVVDLARASRNAGIPLQVVVDIDIGLNRCGVMPGEPALDLAKFAFDQGLQVHGLMGYDGHLQVLPPNAERDEQIRTGSRALVDTAKLLRARKIPVEIVSTGGTGTYNVSGAFDGITEIQAGSYLLMDTLYRDRGSQFRPALTVLATVISKQDSRRAVLDCGVKAMSAERGLPEVKGMRGVKLKALHAVHGLLTLEADSKEIEIGHRIELWVPYHDGTVNLHDRMYGVRNGQVEEVISLEH